MPKPRKPDLLVRFALSYEALKTSGTDRLWTYARQPFGDRERQRFAFDHARAGNDQQGLKPVRNDAVR